MLLNFVLRVYSITDDCLNLINLAESANLQAVDPAHMDELKVDCCTATDITCDSENHVTRVQWFGKGLSGSLNVTAITPFVEELYLGMNFFNIMIPNDLPDSLQVIDLSNNPLIGGISQTLPANLRELYLVKCNLEGPIPNSLPPGLKILNLFKNRMSGELPEFPSSLNDIDFSNGNKFTGTLKLNSPERIFIADNFISDIQVTTAVNLGSCRLSGNAFLDNANVTTFFQNCILDDIFSSLILPEMRRECLGIVQMAKDLHLHVVQTEIFDVLKLDCCSQGSGLVCNSVKQIKKIQWSGLSLHGSINGTLLPLQLNVLVMDGNAIIGSFPQTLPAGLLELNLNNNELSGPVNNLPNGLKILKLDTNFMSGELPVFPNSLQTLELQNNKFTGTLHMNIPNSIAIDNNWITDIVIVDTTEINYCALAGNPLLDVIDLYVDLQNICDTSNLYTLLDLSMMHAECTDMIQLAKDIHLDVTVPEMFSSLEYDCCAAQGGLSCDNLKINYILWDSLGLYGNVNASLFPKYVTVVYIQNNELTGDLTLFPDTIQQLQINDNHFTGSLHLKMPLFFFAQNNYITDLVFDDISQLPEAFCDFSNNPLLGNSNIVVLTMCTQNDLYDSVELASRLFTVSSTVTTWQSSEMATPPTSTVTTDIMTTPPFSTVKTDIMTTTSIRALTTASAINSQLEVTRTMGQTSSILDSISTTNPIVKMTAISSVEREPVTLLSEAFSSSTSLVESNKSTLIQSSLTAHLFSSTTSAKVQLTFTSAKAVLSTSRVSSSKSYFNSALLLNPTSTTGDSVSTLTAQNFNFVTTEQLAKSSQTLESLATVKSSQSAETTKSNGKTSIPNAVQSDVTITSAIKSRSPEASFATAIQSTKTALGTTH